MKKIRKMKIPEKYNTLSKKLNYIGKKIDRRYDKVQRSGATATRWKVEMGEYFINAKKIVKEHKGKWEYHLARRFSYIGQRTVERCMDLARHVDLEKYPALAFLSQECLTDIITYRKKSSVGAVLKKHGVDASRSLDGRDSIGIFKKEAEAVLEKLSGGWLDIDVPANPFLNKNKETREKAKFDAHLRKIRKEPWENAPPEKVAKQINSRGKTVKKGLYSLMEHRPGIYNEIDMDLLKELYELLGNFLKLYKWPADELPFQI